MPHTLPGCKNKTCPSYLSNREVIVIKETPQEVVFGCKTCTGVEVRTLDWRRGQQANYERLTNPEYARQQKRFFLGKLSHRGG
jgi:hypothetical protein